MPTVHHGRIAARRALLDAVHAAAESLRAAGAAACASGRGGDVEAGLSDIDVFGTELIYAYYPAGAAPAGFL